MTARIDEVKTDLKEDIEASESRMTARIDEVKTDLKQDIHNVEARLSARIDGNGMGPKADEETDAEAV